MVNLTTIRQSIDTTFDENPVLYAIGVGISVAVLILAYLLLFAYYLAPRYAEWATGGRVTVPVDEAEDDAGDEAEDEAHSRKVQFQFDWF